MWGCDFLPFTGRWRGDFFPESIGAALIWGMVVLLVVYLAISIFKFQFHNSPGSSRDRMDSLAILKVRFARGDISREEFIRMKQVISQP